VSAKRLGWGLEIGVVALVVNLIGCGPPDPEAKPAKEPRPNIILMMADDMGYGDVGFNGNTAIKTPHLDQMARDGAILTNFHAGGPVCSPTRATSLTGRHHYRYGIWAANSGHLPAEEITLAEILKARGYATGLFGKWHLGTLDAKRSAKGRTRSAGLRYSPPSLHGFDKSFVTETAVTTWDPGYGSRAADNPFYDDGVAVDPDAEDSNLRGGAARVVMDRVIPFVRGAAQSQTPFLAVVWFHAPHMDIEAGPEYLAKYPDEPEDARHYYGCITEMDEQIGRLRAELEQLSLAADTQIWFASDNGPEGVYGRDRFYGTTDGMRGRKRTLFEGGVRVPGLVVWPGHVEPGSINDGLMSTLDYLPTIADLVGYTMPDLRPVDGVSLLEMIEGKRPERPEPIPFRYTSIRFGSTYTTLIDGHLKFGSNLGAPALAGGEDEFLYDLSVDRAEEHNLIAAQPERAAEMRGQVEAFLESARRSHRGDDYGDVAYAAPGSWETIEDSAKRNAQKVERKAKKKEVPE